VAALSRPALVRNGWRCTTATLAQWMAICGYPEAALGLDPDWHSDPDAFCNRSDIDQSHEPVRQLIHDCMQANHWIRCSHLSARQVLLLRHIRKDQDNKLRKQHLDTGHSHRLPPLQKLLHSLFDRSFFSASTFNTFIKISRHTPYSPFLRAIQQVSLKFERSPDLLQNLGTVWIEAMKARAESRRTSNPDEYATRTYQVDFLKIVDTSKGTIYYGGDQAWFNRYTQRFGGCGPTAAANMMAYMAIYDPRLSNLYDYDLKNLTKDDFSKFMEEVYAYVTPNEVPFVNDKSDLAGKKWRGIPPSLGITNVSRFAEGVEAFAASKGVSLKAQWSNEKPTFQNAVDYIRTGLEKNRPVALLNMFHPVDLQYTNPETGKRIETDYQQHWVIITGMIENKRLDILVFSCWRCLF